MKEHTIAARQVLRDTLQRTLDSMTTQREDTLERLETAEQTVRTYLSMMPVHDARIAEFKDALAALDAREAADTPPAERYAAVINTPGYLPEGDEPPPVFDTAREAWDWLAEQRQRHEDSAMDAVDADPDHPIGYSGTWRLLAQLGDAAAWLTTRGDGNQFISAALDLDSLSIHPNVNELGLGSVWGNTPGSDDDNDQHDLGIAYSVMIAEPEGATTSEELAEGDETHTLCCDKGPHDHGGRLHFLLAPSDLDHHLPARHGITVEQAGTTVTTGGARQFAADRGIDVDGYDDLTVRLLVWHERFHGMAQQGRDNE